MTRRAHSPETRAKMRAAAIRNWQDPAVREARSAAIAAVMQDPERRRRHADDVRRGIARGYVVQAGAPLLKHVVDRALALMSAGEPGEIVVDALAQEFGRRAP